MNNGYLIKIQIRDMLCINRFLCGIEPLLEYFLIVLTSEREYWLNDFTST
jgi:hypothetical protein